MNVDGGNGGNGGGMPPVASVAAATRVIDDLEAAARFAAAPDETHDRGAKTNVNESFAVLADSATCMRGKGRAPKQTILYGFESAFRNVRNVCLYPSL